MTSVVEVLEDRLLLFVLSGNEWPSTTITYSYSNLLDGQLGNLTPTQLKSVVEEALGLWASYAPLHFVEQVDSGPMPPSTYGAAGHPLIRFGRYEIDGPGSVLAQGFTPGTTGLSGDVHFDSSENFSIGPSPGTFDILEDAVHEIGHALGLEHQPSPSQGGVTAVMNPFYAGIYHGLGTSFLYQDDINGIRYLYGSGTGSVTPLNSGVGDDHGNSASGATVVAVGSTGLKGALEVGGDQDWFQFSAVGGVRYTFETRLDTLPDTILQLYAADGTTSLAFNDDNGASLSSLIQWTAPTTGTYFLKVASFSSTDTGTYTLNMTHQDDHGASAATATALSANLASAGKIGVVGDRDWFSLNVTAGQTYRVLLDAQDLPHGRLTLYASDGSTALLTGNGQGAGTDPWLIWTADASGTVYVSAAGNSSEIGSYSISYTAVDGLVASTPATGMAAQVRVFNSSDQVELFSFVAYGAFAGGAHVALGDVNGDGIADVITGANAGAGPHVRVISGANGADLMSFFAYDSGFTGGVRVAAGDVNGDGKDDIITSPGSGGPPHIRVFAALTYSLIYEFYPYPTEFTGGVYVASADVNDDGYADIVTGTGAGVSPHVKVISGANGSTELHSFYAYSPAFLGGIFVAAGDVNNDGKADLVTAPGYGGGPHVRIWNGGTGVELAGFFPYSTQFIGGVRVAAADVNDDGHADIITGPGSGATADVRVFSGNGYAQLEQFIAYDTSYTNGVFLAGAPAALPGGGSSPIMAASESAPPTPGDSTATTLAEHASPEFFEFDLATAPASTQDETAVLGRPQDVVGEPAIFDEDSEPASTPDEEGDAPALILSEREEWNSVPDASLAEVFDEKLFNQLMA